MSCLPPDALAIRACELPLPASGQLEDPGVRLPIFAAFHFVFHNNPLVLPEHKRCVGSFRLGCCVLQNTLNPQLPAKLFSLVFNKSVLESQEVHFARPRFVPRHIDPVNVGIRAETPELKVHLLGMITSAVHELSLRMWKDDSDDGASNISNYVQTLFIWQTQGNQPFQIATKMPQFSSGPPLLVPPNPGIGTIFSPV